MKDKFAKFVVQRRTLYVIVALVTVMALTITFFPATPPAKVAHAQTNILSYWNFNNCMWGEYWNYNDQNQLVNGGSNYKTWTRWWTTRCGGSPADRDPCGTNANYVRWNIKAESNACYWRSGQPDDSKTDVVVYLDKGLTTLDWTHPVSGTSNFSVVALTGWVPITTTASWDWSLCGSEDAPDDQCTNNCSATSCAANCGPCGSSGCYGLCADAGGHDCTKYNQVFYGADTSSVKPYVYTPTSWDFSTGGWYYCTHAQHYVSTMNGNYCDLGWSNDDTVRGDWCVFVEYLGSKTFGTSDQFTGNTIRVTQWEGAYYLDSSGKTPGQRVAWDVVEEWYLQENRGIVEIRQWQNGDHKVTAKLARWGKVGYSSDGGSIDPYCTCCNDSSVCNQCYYQ